MAFATIGPIVSFISGLFSTANSINNLFFSGGGLSLADIQRIQISVDAHFFIGENLADLLSIRNLFYGSFQTTLQTRTIVRADLQQGGWLRPQYERHFQDINKVYMILGRLDWVWRNNTLHIDTLAMLMRIFTDGYATLVHMQAVYSQLHLVELGLTSLDHPSLLADTLDSLTYVNDALSRLPAIRDSVRARRLNQVSPVSETGGNSGYVTVRYSDNYSSLSATPAVVNLYPIGATGPQPNPNPYPEAWQEIAPASATDRVTTSSALNQFYQKRNRRYNQVAFRVATTGHDDVTVLWGYLDTLQNQLQWRQAIQRTQPPRSFHAKVFYPAQETVACQVLIPLYSRPDKETTLAVHDVTLVQAEWRNIEPEEGETSLSPEKVTYQYSTGIYIAKEDRLLNATFPMYVPGMSIQFGDVKKTFNVDEIIPVPHIETVSVGADKKKYFYQKVYTFRSDVRFVFEAGDEQCVLDTDDEKHPFFKTFRWTVASDEVITADEEYVKVENIDMKEGPVQRNCKTIPHKNITTVPLLCKYALEGQLVDC